MIKVLIKECNLMNVNNSTSFKPNVEDIALRNQLEDWLDTQIAELPYAMRINNSFEARITACIVNLLNYILLEKVVQILHVQHYLIPQMALMRK